MRLFGLKASWFLGVGLLVGGGMAQEARSVSGFLASGDADIAAILSGRVDESRWNVTVPGMPYQPTQLNARANTSAAARLFGVSREAVYTNAQSMYRDGTWLVDPVTRAVTNYSPSPYGSVAGVLRVAGQTVFALSSSSGMWLDRTAMLPLLSATSPAHALGPVTVRVVCQVNAIGRWRGSLRLQPRTAVNPPWVNLFVQGYGSYAISAAIRNETGFGSTSMSSTIQLGNPLSDAYSFVSPSLRESSLMLSTDAIRLYVRACLSVAFFNTCRILYDKAFPAVRRSWAI